MNVHQPGSGSLTAWLWLPDLFGRWSPHRYVDPAGFSVVPTDDDTIVYSDGYAKLVMRARFSNGRARIVGRHDGALDYVRGRSRGVDRVNWSLVRTRLAWVAREKWGGRLVIDSR